MQHSNNIISPRLVSKAALVVCGWEKLIQLLVCFRQETAKKQIPLLCSAMSWVHLQEQICSHWGIFCSFLVMYDIYMYFFLKFIFWFESSPCCLFLYRACFCHVFVPDRICFPWLFCLYCFDSFVPFHFLFFMQLSVIALHPLLFIILFSYLSTSIKLCQV